MDEILLRDQNHVPVLGAITNDASQLIRMLRVDPATGRVLVNASGSASGTVTSISQGTGITLTPNPITTTGSVALTVPVVVTNGGTGTTTQFTAGSVVFAGVSGVYSQDNANFFYNSSTHSLGIGTATPTLGRLQVQNTTTDFIYMNVTNNNAASGIVAFNGGTQGNSAYLEAYGSTFAGTSSGINRAGLSEFGANTNTALLIRNVANTNTYLSTNDVVRMTITPTGAVDIVGGAGGTIGNGGLSIGGLQSAFYGIDINTNQPFLSTIVNTLYANTNNPAWITRKARGTFASPTAVQAGDILGDFPMQGRDGSGNWLYGTDIAATVTGAPSTACPTDLVFKTSSASVALTEIMRLTSSINSSGHAGMVMSDANTQVVFGSTIPETNSRFTIDTNPASYNNTAFRKFGANAFGPGITMYANRSTTSASAFTAVVADDSLGFVSFWGADGAAFRNAASIQCFVDGTPGSSDMPGRLVFFTTPDGSATALEALRIDNTQSILLKQKITNYSNVATSGWGVPAIYASGRSTAQTTAVASVSTYTVGAADGSFEISANVLVTTSSAENFTVTCAYTDEGNTSRVLTLNFQTIAGVIGTAVNFANGTVPYEGILTHIRAKASTAITIATTGTFTGATYNVEGIIKQMK